MNGPEHYAEADRLLGDIHEMAGNREAPELAVRAQAHATLALAAATAEIFSLMVPYGRGEVTDNSARAWREVIRP